MHSEKRANTMSEPTGQPIINPSVPVKNHRMLIIGLVIVVVLLAVAVVYMATRQTAIAPTTNNSNNTTNQTSQTIFPNSYHSDNYGFTIQYPNDLGFITGVSQFRSAVGAFIPPCDDNTVACVFYKRGTYPGTNFDSAGVSVNILADIKTEAACRKFDIQTSEVNTATGTQTVNGTLFYTGTGGGGATGHSDQIRSFHNFRNATCYEINLRIAQTNIDNYPPGTIKAFNEREVWIKLEQVFSTFKFTN